MFKFLKEKIQSAVSKISNSIEENASEEVIEEVVEKPKLKPKKEKPKKEKPKTVDEEIKETIKEIKEDVDIVLEKDKGFFSKLKEKIISKEEKKVDDEDVSEKEKEEKNEKEGFFEKITKKVTTKKVSEEQFEGLFWDLELALLENNVAVEVIEKIKEDLKKVLVNQPIKRNAIFETIQKTLVKTIDGLFDVETFNFLEKVNAKKPFVICFVGINGSGKTTTIAKVTHLLQQHNKSVVLAAGDTFRSAAIQQLGEWANKLNVKMISHDYGSDPAAVAFDAIKYAESKNIDVVLIDTAGRLHSNVDLMNEMKKIIKVANPDVKIFIGESITGNDVVEQVQKFNEAIGIDGIILSKADIDEKGGAALSVSYVTGRPILYLGVGQELDDLKKFDKEFIKKNLGVK